MRLIQQKKSGTTLLEILLYVGILSIVVVALSVLIYQILQAKIRAQLETEINQQAAQVIAIISQNLRDADSINSPALGTSAASLSINTYNPVNNPTVFDVNSNAVRITQGANAPVNLIDANRTTISNFNVINLSRSGTPGVVRVTFTLSSVNLSGLAEFNYSKDFIVTEALR